MPTIPVMPAWATSARSAEFRSNRQSEWYRSSNIRPFIGTENPIPEEMNHREIAARMSVMDKVQLLFASEPRKALKPRSLYVILLVEKDVRVK